MFEPLALRDDTTTVVTLPLTEKTEQSYWVSLGHARLFCVCNLSLDKGNSSSAVTLFCYHASSGWHLVCLNGPPPLPVRGHNKISTVKCCFGSSAEYSTWFVSC